MRELLIAIVGMILESMVFFSIGSLVMKALKMKSNASFAFVTGYLVYFAVFELIATPMTLAWAPLKTLTIVWTVIAAAVVAAAVCILRKQWIGQLKEIPGIWKEHSFMFFAAAAVVLLQCAIVVLYEDTTVDAAYYVGTVTTSVYTGTLARYNPYTGTLLSVFKPRYIFSAYPMNNAVWCELLGIPAIIQAKVVMSAINVIAANLIIYHIGKRFFHGGKRQADLMVCFVCLMQLFSYTIYTPGTFFFTRSYEGKAILANVSIPIVLYCCIWLWQEKKDRNVWVLLFVSSLSAVAFSGSAVIFPVVISAGILPLILMRKQFSQLVSYAVCMLPSILYAAAYVLATNGWLTLKAS